MGKVNGGWVWRMIMEGGIRGWEWKMAMVIVMEDQMLKLDFRMELGDGKGGRDWRIGSEDYKLRSDWRVRMEDGIGGREW